MPQMFAFLLDGAFGALPQRPIPSTHPTLGLCFWPLKGLERHGETVRRRASVSGVAVLGPQLGHSHPAYLLGRVVCQHYNKDTADPAVNSASITSQSKYEVPICALSKLLACCAKGSIPTGNRDEIGDRTLDMGTRWDIERMAEESSLPACQLPA